MSYCQGEINVENCKLMEESGESVRGVLHFRQM